MEDPISNYLTGLHAVTDLHRVGGASFANLINRVYLQLEDLSDCVENLKKNNVDKYSNVLKCFNNNLNKFFEDMVLSSDNIKQLRITNNLKRMSVEKWNIPRSGSGRVIQRRYIQGFSR